MALMLRQACTGTLSSFDLDAYHADIDSNTKHLCLYTPCGKRFATIHGVVFSRLHPTKAEIDYAVELLEQWCERNVTMINEYIDAFEILQRMEEPKAKFRVGDNRIEIARKQASQYNHEKRAHEYVYTVSGITIQDNYWTFCLDRNLGVKSITFHANDEENRPYQPLPVKFNLPKKLMEAALERAEELDTFYTAQEKVNTTLAELNSCKH